MNKFYDQTTVLLWAESILLLVAGFYPALIIVKAGDLQPVYYLLFAFYIPVLQFCMTPISKLTGMYKYYSPMLLGYMPNKKQIDLHSGTSFDYLFIMRKYKVGAESRNRILVYHLEGLLSIIKSIETGDVPPTVNIIGTSYFFNERTIRKLGFTEETPTVFYRINLMMNFVDLIWMYSVAKGHFAVPQLWNAKKVKIEGSELIKRKDFIFDLHTKMNSKQLAARHREPEII